MPPYQERVIAEQQALTEKLVKLRQYIATEEFQALGHAERNLLIQQSTCMTNYSDILAQRIALFDT